MDFDTILSEYKTTTCIMSVEKFENGGYGNIRTVMRCADEKMYEDKKRFYEEHPEMKGR